MNGGFLGAVASHLRTRVVQVLAGHRPGSGGGAGMRWPDGTCSGGGLLVTNAHVATTPRVTVVTPDGRASQGEVVRRDAQRDLALIRAPEAAVPPVEIADPQRLRPGTLVFAVGHPFGVQRAVSAGVIQATGRLPPGLGVPGPQASLPWVQADVRLAPGNSGGPLANHEGQVIGIAAMIVAGLALAIPAPDVEAFVARASPGRRLGLVAHPVVLTGIAGTGLALDRVEPGMPAERAGLVAGDVLVAVGGRPLHSTSDLVWSVRQASEEWLTVDLVRDGSWRRHAVPLPRSTV